MVFGGASGFSPPPSEASQDLEHYFTQIAAEIEELFEEVSNVLPSATTGDFLRYDGSDWVAATISSGDLPSHVHDTSDITTGTFADARIAQSNVTQHEGAIDHDALTGFVAAEHINWSVTGAEDINVDRITSAAVTQHEADLTILESQITDGSILARLAAAETITAAWAFESTITARAITPETDSTYDLGTTGTRWAEIFADDITLTNQPWADILQTTFVYDFPSISGNSTATTTTTVTGAATGDAVYVTPVDGFAQHNIHYRAYVSAADTVTVQAFNTGTGAINPASFTYHVLVLPQ